MTNNKFNTAWAAWQTAAKNCQKASRDNFAASLQLAKAIYERHEAWLAICQISPNEFKPSMAAEMAHLGYDLPLSRQRQVEYKNLWAWLLSLGCTLEGLQGLPNLTLNMLETMQSANLNHKEFGQGCTEAAIGTYETWREWLIRLHNQKAVLANAKPGLTKFKPLRFSGEGHHLQSVTIWQLAREQGINLDPSIEYEIILRPKALSIPPESQSDLLTTQR